MQNKSYIVNKQGVYADNFDQESVVVNLNVGNYYSLRNIASKIWNTLDIGAKPMEFAVELANFYKIDLITIEHDLEKFIQTLVNEGLIFEFDDVTSQSLDLNDLACEYIAPELETFNDLQDLFLLDPVHAIDDKMGWPIQATK